MRGNSKPPQVPAEFVTRASALKVALNRGNIDEAIKQAVELVEYIRPFYENGTRNQMVYYAQIVGRADETMGALLKSLTHFEAFKQPDVADYASRSIDRALGKNMQKERDGFRAKKDIAHFNPSLGTATTGAAALKELARQENGQREENGR